MKLRITLFGMVEPCAAPFLEQLFVVEDFKFLSDEFILNQGVMH